MFRPPKNDDERLMNLLEALSEPPVDGPDAIDEMIQEELARRGYTMEAYAAELQAKTEAVLARHRRAERDRAEGEAGEPAGRPEGSGPER